jgi:transcriptional regulator with XRE-family HTH domain
VPRHFAEEHIMPTRRIADPLAQKIGARIRDLRMEKGKSLAALAEASDVSTGHLSCIERGYVVMNVATLGRIAKGLGVTAANLLTETTAAK